MLLIANGFKRCNDAVECDFIKIQDVDFFKNTHSDVLEIWLDEEELEDIGKQLERSILIGGMNGTQQFILIPPLEKNENWKYWKFAHWIPGEQEYKGLREYIQRTIDFINQSI